MFRTQGNPCAGQVRYSAAGNTALKVPYSIFRGLLWDETQDPGAESGASPWDIKKGMTGTVPIVPLLFPCRKQSASCSCYIQAVPAPRPTPTAPPISAPGRPPRIPPHSPPIIPQVTMQTIPFFQLQRPPLTCSSSFRFSSFALVFIHDPSLRCALRFSRPLTPVDTQRPAGMAPAFSIF